MTRPGFVDIVNKVWRLNLGGTITYRLTMKVRRLKSEIKKWCKSQPTLDKQISNVVDLLNTTNMGIVADPTDERKLGRSDEIKSQLYSLMEQEEHDLKQKSRTLQYKILWANDQE